MEKTTLDTSMKTDQATPAAENIDAAAKTRRNFLLGATLGTAGAVAAAVVGGAREALEVAAPAKLAEAKKPKGYHLTEHVSQYYDTTRM
jgi:hypothetical protein